MKTLHEILFIIYGEEEQLLQICVFAVLCSWICLGRTLAVPLENDCSCIFMSCSKQTDTQKANNLQCLNVWMTFFTHHIFFRNFVY